MKKNFLLLNKVFFSLCFFCIDFGFFFVSSTFCVFPLHRIRSRYAWLLRLMHVIILFAK